MASTLPTKLTRVRDESVPKPVAKLLAHSGRALKKHLIAPQLHHLIVVAEGSAWRPAAGRSELDPFLIANLFPAAERV